MAADVVFVPNPAAWQRAFRSWEGMTGRHIANKTAKARLLGSLEAPAPGRPPRNRTGLNYATGRLAVGGIVVARGRWGLELEGQVIAVPDHAILLHNGTVPHVITPRTGKTLRFHWKKIGKVVHSTVVHHPGTAANDFLFRGLKKAIPA